MPSQQPQLPPAPEEIVAAVHRYVETDAALRDAQRAHGEARKHLLDILRRSGIHDLML